jgi:hypothetical protein
LKVDVKDLKEVKDYYEYLGTRQVFTIPLTFDEQLKRYGERQWRFMISTINHRLAGIGTKNQKTSRRRWRRYRASSCSFLKMASKLGWLRPAKEDLEGAARAILLNQLSTLST